MAPPLAVLWPLNSELSLRCEQSAVARPMTVTMPQLLALRSVTMGQSTVPRSMTTAMEQSVAAGPMTTAMEQSMAARSVTMKQLAAAWPLPSFDAAL